MKSSNLLNAACLALFLTACGGGGGGGGSSTPTQPSNNSPTVNISGVAEADSSNIISLTANATDSDGSIASYTWTVDSGAIALNDASKLEVSFIAPSVESDAIISLSVTVADNKGATAKATKQITVKKKISLTITGLVLDGGVIPNADVTFTLGDSTFATKANAAGQYSITISASNKNLNTPVIVTAVGDSTNPTIKLASQLYSVSKLIEQAGSDKTLDAKENLSVNISNVTTAEYALLKIPASWGFNIPIATDEELQSAQNSIGSSQKISMASYLQIISTDSRFKLPESHKNTLDFLQDQTAVNNFYNQVYAKDAVLISNTAALINADNNLVKNNGSMAGQYLLYNLSGTNSYRLTLSEDLTGKLEAGNFTASVKWIQDGSKLTLNFPVPVETKELGSSSRFVIKTAELNIYNNYSEYSLANFILFGDQIYSDDSQGYASNQSMTVLTYNTAKLVPLTAEKIAGEWMSDAGSYKFNTDKTASYIPYDPAAQAVASNWSVDNNKLVLQNDAVKEEFYLLNDLGAGYSILKIYNNQNGLLFRFATGWLIKPQSNLPLTKADFVGRWIDRAAPITTGNSYIRVMSSDNQFFTNFAAWPTPWSSKEGSNSWERNIYLQNQQRESSCDLSAGTHPDCQLYINYSDKVIAVKGDQYYSLHAEKFYLNSGESSVSYSLVQSIKLPEITYFGGWITDNVVKVFYQKTADGIKVWNFLDNKLVINNKSLADRFLSESAINFSLSNNRLQYTRDNVARELMLVSASENGLTVCEYNQGASCVAGTEFLLSNRSPAKISLKVEGSGTVSPYTTGNPAAWFGNVANFYITPDAGSLVKSVTGCGGQRSSDRYITAEIRDACTITATFSKIPIVTLKAGAHGTIKNYSGYEYSISPDIGYMVDAASGCNGVLIDGQYPSYVIKEPPGEDCTITVNFKQKLSVEAKISDQGLASCLDALNVKNITLVTQLDCQNDVVSSLEGIQNLPSLSTLTVPKVVSSNGITVPEINSLQKLTLGSWNFDVNASTFDVTSIDVSRAKNIGELKIENTRINSINLNGLNDLHTIYFANNPFLKEVDISKTNLRLVQFQWSSLKKIILPENGSLTDLFLDKNHLSELDLSTSPHLNQLQISYNQLTSLDLHAVPKLTILNVHYNQLTNLNLSKQTNLWGFGATYNLISNLDLSNNNELHYLDLSSNQLMQISLTNLKKLETLVLSDNKIANIDLSAVNELKMLALINNKLTTLAVGNLVKINEIFANDNNLATVSGLESINNQADIQLYSNKFDANTLVYLNNLKTAKNYTNLIY